MLVFWDQMFTPGRPEGESRRGEGGAGADTGTHHPDEYRVCASGMKPGQQL